MLIPFILACLVLLPLWIYLFYKWKFSYWKTLGVPSLPPTIPYGNYKGVNTTIHIKDLLSELYFKFKNQSPVCGLYLLFSPIVLILDLDLLKNVLIKDFNCFHDRATYYNEKDDPVSAQLFALAGDKWKRLRNKLTPTFTSGKMKFMLPKVVEISNRLVDTLSEMIQNESEVEVRELYSRFTTDIIGECAFGIDCNTLKNPAAEFREKGRAIAGNPRHSRIVSNILRQFPNVGRKLHIKLLRDDISEFYLRIVRETVNYREANNIRRNDFMDLLIELKNHDDGLGNLTIEEIAAQSFVFFLAGYETTSIALAFTTYELALNGNVQEKAREEIFDVLGKFDGELTYDAIKDMRYLDQVVSETLRKYPPIPTLTRYTKYDYKIPNSNITIQKDTMVMIPAYAIHHDPDIYADPYRFNPDRFDPDEVSKRHTMTFLGFGDGPRTCIAARFARMQYKIGLIKLLVNFRIRKSPRTESCLVFNNSNSALATKDGIYVNIERIS